MRTIHMQLYVYLSVEKSVARQLIYQDEGEYFLVEIYKDTIDRDVVTLKVKREGWHDTWSLPLQLERDINDSND